MMKNGKFCGWTYIDIESEYLEEIRDYLSEELLEVTDAYQKEKDLHLTVHPGFKILDEESLIDLNNIVKNYQNNMKKFNVHNISCHPKKENPRVIYMEPDLRLSNLREEISNIIEEDNGNIIREPCNPHITLLKVQGNQDISKFRDQILEKINSTEKVFNTTCNVTVNSLLMSQIE